MREQIKLLSVKLKKKRKKACFRQDGKNFETLVSNHLFRDEITIVKRWRCDGGPFFFSLEQIEYLRVRMVGGLYDEQRRYVFGGYMVVRKHE